MTDEGPGSLDPPERRRPRPWRTVRFRVTAVALAAVLVLLVAAAAVLLGSVRSQLTEQLDDELVARTEQLAASVAQGDLPGSLSDLDDDTLVQVRSADGSIVLQSPELDEDPEERLEIVAQPPTTADGTPSSDDDDVDEVDDGPEEIGLPVRVTTQTFDGDDDEYRVASTAVDGPDGTFAVGVARSVVDLEVSVRSLAGTLAVAVPVVSLLLAIVTWVLVGRTLRPVDAIRRQVAGIGAGELDRRVPEPGTDDEIDHLARTMNQMLGRLDEGVQREQRFVSDASHELRSPLTRMRLGLEVDRAHPETADAATTEQALLDEVIGMERLVDELLQLARLDSAGSYRKNEPVDLDDLVFAEIEAISRTADVRFDRGGVGAAQIYGDQRALSRMVRNLVENACDHARTVVAVSLSESARDIVLVVSDDGPGIDTHDRDRVFDRFVRLDEARTAGAGGVGLGLAITRAIVERHGGTIVIEDSSSGGATFRVTLPRTVAVS